MELQNVVAELAVGTADRHSSVAVVALAQRLVGKKAGTEHSCEVAAVASLTAVGRQTAEVAVDDDRPPPAVVVYDSDRAVAT